MSDPETKEKHSRRIKKTLNNIAKQLGIAKSHKTPIDEPHKFAKHHAMDCGTKECYVCGNPRHSEKHGKTKQEYSFEQTEEWVDEND